MSQKKDKTKAQKKAYRAPKLVEYGDLSALTKANPVGQKSDNVPGFGGKTNG